MRSPKTHSQPFAEACDIATAQSPYKAIHWLRLTPRERLRRSWAMRRRLVNPQAIMIANFFQSLDVSKLALIWLERPECSRLPQDFKWTLTNLFTLPEMKVFIQEHSAEWKALSKDHTHELREYGEQLIATGEVSEQLEDEVAANMQQRIRELQGFDRQYWRGIIADLKNFRANGLLVGEGILV